MNIKYRVWHVMNLDGEGIGKHKFSFPVGSATEGARLINYLVDVELRFPDSVIGSNVFGMEHFEDGEWCEWSDDIFAGIEELADELLGQEGE